MTKIEQLKKEIGSKFFTVVFTKKNGEKRMMNARLGVTKHLKGGTKSYNASDFNYLTVFDMTKKQYRTVNLNTVISIKCKKDLTHIVK